MNKLIVLTDLGTFKAFELGDDSVSSKPRLQPVETIKMEGGDDRIGRRVTDQAGQFRKSAVIFAATNDQGNGERHNICLEDERRSVKQIAEKMSELLEDGRFESCYFAASSEINKTILEHLSPRVRSKIEKNLHCDLVNVNREEILQHFNN